jgi:hypothetical protein
MIGEQWLRLPHMLTGTATPIRCADLRRAALHLIPYEACREAVLDGWPGAAPAELVENLLAVLIEQAQGEADVTRKRRLERLIEAVKELGVSTASEVISKVITGGM